MRCPKCEFISFDHLDFCRKCKKPLGSIAVTLRGSVYDCQPPLFLHFSRLEEAEPASLNNSISNIIEEVEIEPPDMNIMRSPAPVPAQSADVENLAGAPLAAVSAATMAVAGIGAAAIEAIPPPSPSTLQFAAKSADRPEATMTPAWPENPPTPLAPPKREMEIPAALADISDLAPPERDVEFTEAEGDYDLDLNLDLDLGFDLQDLQNMEEDAELQDTESKFAVAPRKSPAVPVDMDSDLDFALDLGGLSLHDYDTSRK